MGFLDVCVCVCVCVFFSVLKTKKEGGLPFSFLSDNAKIYVVDWLKSQSRSHCLACSENGIQFWQHTCTTTIADLIDQYFDELCSFFALNLLSNDALLCLRRCLLVL